MHATNASLTSNTVGPTVNKAATTTALASSLDGQAVTFTATVMTVAPGTGIPGGTVEFMDGATPPPCVTAGHHQYQCAAPGVHSMLVTYGGDPSSVHGRALYLSMTARFRTQLAWRRRPAAHEQRAWRDTTARAGLQRPHRASIAARSALNPWEARRDTRRLGVERRRPSISAARAKCGAIIGNDRTTRPRSRRPPARCCGSAASKFAPVSRSLLQRLLDRRLVDPGHPVHAAGGQTTCSGSFWLSPATKGIPGRWTLHCAGTTHATTIRGSGRKRMAARRRITTSV
jgi:hypothetical protein